MTGAVRQGDLCAGTCDMGYEECPHSYSGGVCSGGSPSVFFNSKSAVRIGDTGETYCPHGGSFSSDAGSSTVFINGIAAVRIGDGISCMKCGQPGSHTTGSESVFIGG